LILKLLHAMNVSTLINKYIYIYIVFLIFLISFSKIIHAMCHVSIMPRVKLVRWHVSNHYLNLKLVHIFVIFITFQSIF